MQNNRNKNKSFLGHKRNDEKNEKEEDMIIKKEKSYKKITLKIPELIDITNNEKNDIELNEGVEGKKHILDLDNNHCKNLNQTSINIEQNQICKKCGHENSVVTFNSFKDILCYFNQNRHRISFKHSVLIKKTINKRFKRPLTICENCLLKLSNDEIEFEKFISMIEINYSDNDENPFKNLYGSSNLKYFNDKEIIDNNKNILSLSNKKNDEFFESESILNRMHTIDNKLINAELNDSSKNKNNYILQNINSNNENINNQFLPFINYNGSSDQKYWNIFFPKTNYNSMNNYHNIVYQNNNFQDRGLQDNNININQSLPIQYYNLNDPDFLRFSYLNQQEGFIPYNNISNTKDFQFINRDNFNEKNIDLNDNITQNNNTKMKIENEERQKDNNIHNYENDEESEIHKNYIMIENKDFNDIIHLSSSLYHKLLDIKFKMYLNVDLNKSNQDYQNLDLNFFNSNFNNNKFFNNDIIFDLNQLSNINYNELYLNNLKGNNNSGTNNDEINNFKNSFFQNQNNKIKENPIEVNNLIIENNN